MVVATAGSYGVLMLLRSRQQVLSLAAVQLGDAAFNVVATEWVRDDLDRLRVPQELRHVFPVIKTVSAVGLVGGLRWPQLGRVTSAALVAYFVLALGAHRRARDELYRYAPAATMLAWSFAAMRAYRDVAGGTAHPRLT